MHRNPHRDTRSGGTKEEEMMDIADLIYRTLTSREDAAAVAKLREEVPAFSRKFPLPF